MGSIKHALRRSIGRSLLSLNDYQTLLIEIEEMLNTRPLTVVSDDVDNGIPLTPNNFLKPVGHETIPTFPLSTDANEKLRKSLQRRNNLLSDFWKRWLAEYLNQLHLWRQRKQLGQFLPSVGDLVLVKENCSRLLWPRAVVEKVLNGRDGHPRVCWVRIVKSAKDKTGKSKIIHSVVRRTTKLLYPLELADIDNSVITTAIPDPVVSSTATDPIDNSIGHDPDSIDPDSSVGLGDSFDVLDSDSDSPMLDSVFGLDFEPAVMAPRVVDDLDSESSRRPQRPRNLPAKLRDYYL